MRHQRITNLALVLAAFASGCATSGAITPRDAAVTESETLPMVALEGYRNGMDFYVKYRLGDRVLYAGGNWSNRVDLVESPLAESANYSAPSLVPMQYHREAPWESLPADVVSIPIFGTDKWQLLRDRLLRSVVPANGAGVVIDFEYAEYFLFHDSAGKFQATLLQDKPPGYPVQQRLYFVEFMRRGRPLVDAFLEEQGITQTEFVLNTGDSGLYSLPFLYLNTERHLVVFVRNVPLRPTAVAAVPGLKSGQAFGHVMQSHLTNLVQRPISSLYRLFFVVTDTAVATVSIDWATGLDSTPPPPLGDAPPMDLQLWESKLDKMSNHPQSSGNVEILVDGEAFFTRLIDRVIAAEDSVHLQTYIFDNDDYAVKIGEMLKRRSNAGVEVKVLLDGLGTISGTMAESESLPEQHVAPASVRRFLESGSQIDVRQKANPWFTGDHVKSTLIDHRIAFVGGMNIGREYRYDWHDLMVEIQGPVVDTIDREFKLAWGHAGPLGDLGYLIAQAAPRETNSQAEGYPLRILLTRPGNYEIYKTQLEAIRRARSYIYIQNAYFTDDSLLRELVLARRRGVDVRVIIPMESDHGAIGRSNVLAANLMLKHGIRVFIYPGFSHVKAAIYDGWVCLGSANFDRWSLRLNRELNLASSAPAVAEQLLERLFEPDFRLSPELLEPVPDRWVDHLVEIVGDYLY